MPELNPIASPSFGASGAADSAAGDADIVVVVVVVAVDIVVAVVNDDDGDDEDPDDASAADDTDTAEPRSQDPSGAVETENPSGDEGGSWAGRTRPKPASSSSVRVPVSATPGLDDDFASGENVDRNAVDDDVDNDDDVDDDDDVDVDVDVDDDEDAAESSSGAIGGSRATGGGGDADKGALRSLVSSPVDNDGGRTAGDRSPSRPADSVVDSIGDGFAPAAEDVEAAGLPTTRVRDAGDPRPGPAPAPPW